MEHPTIGLVVGRVFALIALLASASPLAAQDKSVRPGINKPFENPNVAQFVGTFERDGREPFDHRQQIVEACRLRPGMVVADIGTGTGLFARMFSPLVGAQGRVYAVDISDKFVKHVEATAREQGLTNIAGVVCRPDSVNLPADSTDLAFICDTYHHFEFPLKVMRSLHRALRPGGQLVLIDFQRIEGKTSAWVLSHVRAGQEVFTREVLDSGFRQVEDRKDLLKESYFVRFEKAAERKTLALQNASNAEDAIRGQFPVIRREGVPPLVRLIEKSLTRTFPEQRFFVLRFRQYPVARMPPKPLAANNLFAVNQNGRVSHLTDTKELENFFRAEMSRVTGVEAAKEAVKAWLRLSEEFKQDGFFEFSIPEDTLAARALPEGWSASGRVLVTQGGKGEIVADLTFAADGKLVNVQEKSTVKPGVRPLCQATKLLDPDPIVRQMAEKDILVMGRAESRHALDSPLSSGIGRGRTDERMPARQSIASRAGINASWLGLARCEARLLFGQSVLDDCQRRRTTIARDR